MYFDFNISYAIVLRQHDTLMAVEVGINIGESRKRKKVGQTPLVMYLNAFNSSDGRMV